MIIYEMARRIGTWVVGTFGLEVFTNPQERGRRFVEEAIEINQVLGVSREEILKIVDHVYSRPVGELDQEIGGVGVTFLALCEALRKDFVELTHTELKRIEALPPDHFRKRHTQKAEAGIGMMPAA